VEWKRGKGRWGERKIGRTMIAASRHAGCERGEGEGDVLHFECGCFRLGVYTLWNVKMESGIDAEEGTSRLKIESCENKRMATAETLFEERKKENLVDLRRKRT
jgi:hypothetical protein